MHRQETTRSQKNKITGDKRTSLVYVKNLFSFVGRKEETKPEHHISEL